MTKSFISALVLFLCTLLLLPATSALAAGAASSGMAGVEVSLPAAGLPFNPAASSRITSNEVSLGVGVPENTGLPMYVVVHQPAEAMASSLSGTLGAVRTVTTYIDAGSGLPVQRVQDEITYQVAEGYASGAFGIGLRWLNETDKKTKVSGKAWRIDLGWQQRLFAGLVFGVAAKDVLGSNLEYGNGTEVPRSYTWKTGLSYQAGSILTVAADAWDFNKNNSYIPDYWATGLEVTPFNFVQLRAGYQSAPAGAKITVGGGLQLGTWRVEGGAALGNAPRGIVGVSLMF